MRRPQRALLAALLTGLAFLLAALPAPSARADELVPAVPAGDAIPTATEQPSDTGQVDPGPVTVDPAPQPEPQPQPDPAPPPEAQQPAETPVPAPAEHTQSVPDRGGDSGANDPPAQTAAPSAAPVTTTFTVTPPPAAAQAGVTDLAPATTAPLGWDVYDDALSADTISGGNGGSGLGGGPPASIGGLRALGTFGAAAERDDDRAAKAVSRAEPLSAGGTGPGGSGPGQGPSLGLFGAAGGSGAGIALLTLLGMACGWSLIAPDRLRAFLTSTATWRPSAYVPPIERPG